MDPLDLAKFEQLKATGDLPSPKGAALAIIRLTQQDDVALAEVAHVVKADPAFVGRLIKAANSVQLGARRPVASVQDALTILGLPAVRSLALGFSLVSSYTSGKCRSFDYARFWSHSLVCAIALQALTLRTRAAAVEESFCVGLLAQVGRLAMATLFPDDYARVLDQVQADPNADLEALEQQTFVMTHAQLAAAMQLDWGLPRLFAEPTLHHEFPEQAPYAQGSRPYVLLWSLALAERIADICLAGESERRAMMPQLLMLGGKLAIAGDDLVALCNAVARDWREWGALLNVATTVVPPFEDLSRPPPPPQVAGAQGAEAVPDHHRMRILVVDDDAAIRAVLKALLTDAGHEVFEAVDGRQGFDMAIQLQPQIMVIDWQMPLMDGIALTRTLRETKIGRGIYILILTGMEEDERLIEAFETGVDDFMTKPLKPRVLAARLRAGQRVVLLQEEIERDREDIRRFAAELAVTNRRLQEAALTDPLTGFPNRRYAMERIEQEWAVASRSHRPLSCMVIDIDQFKQINDSHGHDVGDAVLKKTAAALKHGLRAQDVVARMGGDEFLVICPDTELAAALACAERVRGAVEASLVKAGAVDVRPKVSIGVAARDETMAAVAALIKCADQGAYIAKQRGRNRIGAPQRPQL